MGDISDLMLDGILCQICGVAMPDIAEYENRDPPGYPRTCPDCMPYSKRQKRINAARNRNKFKKGRTRA